MSRYIVTALALLSLCGCLGTGGTESLEYHATGLVGRSNYGVYSGHLKTGWAVSETRIDRSGGMPVLVDSQELSILHTRTVVTEQAYSLSSPGQLLYCRKSTSHGGAQKAILYQSGDRTMAILRTDSSGNAVRETCELPKRTLLDEIRLRKWLKSCQDVGDSFSTPDVDWKDRSIENKTLTVTYRGEGTATVENKEEPVRLFEIACGNGDRATLQIGDDNQTVNYKSGDFELRLEPLTYREVMDKDTFMEEVGVRTQGGPVSGKTGMDENTASCTVSVSGADGVAEREWQRVIERDGARLVVSLSRSDSASEKVALTEDETERWTSPGEMLVDHPDVVKKLACRDQEEDFEQKVRRLIGIVRSTITGREPSNHGNVLAVLRHGSGDCSDHSLLLISLARAAGIPARKRGGIVFFSTKWGWHAWCELHNGERWIPVDPTLRSECHIGPNYLEVASSVHLGKIEIEVLEIVAKTAQECGFSSLP